MAAKQSGSRCGSVTLAMVGRCWLVLAMGLPRQKAKDEWKLWVQLKIFVLCFGFWSKA